MNNAGTCWPDIGRAHSCGGNRRAHPTTQLQDPKETLHGQTLADPVRGLRTHLVYANGRIHRFLRTKDEAEAHRLKGVIEKTLTQLEDGLLAVPEHLTTQQLWLILRSGGKAVNRPRITPQVAMKEERKSRPRSPPSDTI